MLKWCPFRSTLTMTFARKIVWTLASVGLPPMQLHTGERAAILTLHFHEFDEKVKGTRTVTRRVSVTSVPEHSLRSPFLGIGIMPL